MQEKHPSAFATLNSPTLLWTVDEVLPPDICQDLIARAEEEGFWRTRYGSPGKKERQNARVIINDEYLAQRVFHQVQEVIPQTLVDLHPLHANECLRFYKYIKGDFFRPHQDTDFFVSPTLRSFLTVVVYLNADYQGGELFLPKTNRIIKPTTGQAIVFSHRMVHESKPILEGNKYAFRTDIVYGLK
jgi:predicted 2-oxoglutarate/Fe(II)-dependent dioxygenase YbiX